MANAILGPQCFTCRRRQVKCDSAKPSCLRCGKDNIECKGYKRPVKFIIYTHDKKAKPRREDATYSLDAKIDRCVLSTNDEHVDLFESFDYYETYVMPRTIPAQQPFIRSKIDRKVPWHILPPLIQYCMILSLRSMLTDSESPNTMLVRNSLYHYRNLSLSELQIMLPDAVTDRYGVALAGIILFMGADLSLCRFGSWALHFDAAQKIIILRGGIKRTLSDLPQSRSLLLRFVIADILTASTCSSSSLSNLYDHQSQCNDLLPTLERDLVCEGCICPPVIVQAINRVNILRTDVSGSKSEFSEILHLIQAFDTMAWARSMIDKTDSLLSEDATSHLESLSRCFQLSAALYLFYACSTPEFLPHDSSLNATGQQLSNLLHSFFERAQTDHNGPLYTRLWKFLTWPLFVHVYVRIAWHVHDENDRSRARTDIEMIAVTAVTLKSSALSATAQHLLHILNASKYATTWVWDDGFSRRCGFVL